MRQVWVIVLLGFLILFHPEEVKSAFEDKEVGARALGMGGAFVAVSDDANAIWWNPAGLVQLKNREFTSLYTELFGLEELAYSSLSYGQRMKKSRALGIGWQGFGGDLYKEDTLTVSYSRLFFKRISLGLNLKYMALKIKSAGSAEVWGIDLGTLYKLNKKMKLGLLAYNLNSPEIAGDSLPRKTNIGLAFTPFKKLILALDVKEEKGYDTQICLGEELKITPHFTLRAGAQVNPLRLTGGFGFKFKSLQLDYAYFSHSVLGATHQVSLTIFNL